MDGDIFVEDIDVSHLAGFRCPEIHFGRFSVTVKAKLLGNVFEGWRGGRGVDIGTSDNDRGCTCLARGTFTVALPGVIRLG